MNKRRAFFIIISVSVLLTSFVFGGRSFAVAASNPIANVQDEEQNRPPIANPQTVTTVHNQRVSFTLTGTDPDGDALQFNLTSNPMHGVLTGFVPNMIYIPDEGFVGEDSFTFVVFDGIVESEPATVTIQVINNEPVADPLAVATSMDQRVSFTLTGTDPDGDALQFNLESFPSHGVLTGFVPNMIYIPDEGFVGEDSFTFVVFDGYDVSLPATVSITVTTPPIANPQTVTTVHNQRVSFTLTGTDPDGDALLFNLESFPSHGVLSGFVPDMIYIPDEGFVGEDSFTFVVFDGIVESEPATVTIQVINNEPVADPLAVATSMDQRVSFTLTGTDPDGDALLFNLTANPSHGVLTGFVPNLIYIPNDGYVGEDSFTFVVFDGYEESLPATVSIKVTTPPVANPQTVTTIHNQRVSITLTGSDADGDSLLFNLTGNPSHGVLTGFIPEMIYIPDEGFVGEDSFTFVVFDGVVESEPATVTINVINNPPVADPLAVATLMDQRVSFTLTGSDLDGDALLFNLTGNPTHGVLTGFIPDMIYIPDDGYVGEDSFTFVVFDGYEESLPATVSIKVTTPPVANPQTVTTIHNQRVSITLTGSDADGDSLLFNLTGNPSHGVLTGFIPEMIYIPDEGFVGEDSFTFVVFDGVVESEPATVTINVINNPPVADPLAVATLMDQRVSFTLTGSDPDGDALLFNLTANPSHGVLTGFVPNLIYIPNDGYVGEDSFTFVVFDGYDVSMPATVSITVTPSEPVTVFEDDFESSTGWVRNPYGTDTARRGLWEIANPESVWYFGYKQLGTTVSGDKDLVTGAKAGWLPGDNDVDYGTTSMRSPLISLPADKSISLSLSYYLAHASNSSSSDYLRIIVIGQETNTIFEVLGRNRDVDAAWTGLAIDLSGFAGQQVYLLIEVADLGNPSLVEAAVDDILIIAQ